MNCTVHRLCDLDEFDTAFLMNHAVRSGSDFQGKLLGGRLGEADGTIALVRDSGEIVGWARTEPWLYDESGVEYRTLEAFTRTGWRNRGVCRYAVAALVAAGSVPHARRRPDRYPSPVAVFHATMCSVCRAIGVPYELFEKDSRGQWRML